MEDIWVEPRTGQALDFWSWRAWIPGSRAKPAPRNDKLPAFFRILLDEVHDPTLDDF
jgi:hypothetical protein